MTFLLKVMFLNYFGEEVPFEMYDINFCLPPGHLLSKGPASSYDLWPLLGLSALHLACELVSVSDAECGSLLSFLGCKTSQPPELPFTFFRSVSSPQ